MGSAFWPFAPTRVNARASMLRVQPAPDPQSLAPRFVPAVQSLFFQDDWVEARALEVGFRPAQRFSIRVWAHQNAGEIFGSLSQGNAKAFIAENLGENF